MLNYHALADCTVLVVEDDPFARATLENIIASYYPALTLRSAANGREGLRLFHELQPEIVLTDIEMPEMNGIQMAEQIRNTSPEAHIIVITAGSDPDRLLHCIKIGVSRYVGKPIDCKLLLEAIGDGLSRKALERQVKAQHEALRASEARLRLALTSANAGTWEWSPETDEVFWSEEVWTLYGMERNSRVPSFQGWLEVGHPEDRVLMDQVAWESVATCTELNLEWRVNRSEGTQRWILSRGRPVLDSTGKLVRFIGISVDITKRKQAEEEGRESADRYRHLFSSLQEGFSLHQMVPAVEGGRFVEVNPAFERIMGRNREQVVGRTIKEVFPEVPQHWLDRLAEVAQDGVAVTLEHHLAASDRHLEVHVYRPEQGQIAILYQDVTERRKLQEEREKNERLESLGVLAGGIAHDFNNILMAIAGNVSLARLQVGEEHPAALRLVDCENAITKATGLTRQLLTFARGGEPVKKSLATESLVREAASLFLSGTNCKAEFCLEEGLWSLYADAGQIHQALNNLMLNAVQAMPEGGVVTISAQNVTIPSHDPRNLTPGSYVNIHIKDQGRGIPPQALSKVFDPYFTTKPKGSGLGLTSVFSIVKRHHGAVHATSLPGEGADFEILLPATIQTCDGEAGRPLPDLSKATGDGAVLVMDDEPSIRSIAAEMLKELGYRPTACCDGAEAVRLYREQFEKGSPYDVVILDMTVRGGMGGKEAAARIKTVHQGATVIISSGYSADLCCRGGEDPFQGMVPKPYNLQRLAQELTRVTSKTGAPA